MELKKVAFLHSWQETKQKRVFIEVNKQDIWNIATSDSLGLN